MKESVTFPVSAVSHDGLLFFLLLASPNQSEWAMSAERIFSRLSADRIVKLCYLRECVFPHFLYHLQTENH